MIDLTGAKPFAVGGNRYCYRHPENSDICLKVTRQDVLQSKFDSQSWVKKIFGISRLDDNIQEIKGYNQLDKVVLKEGIYDHIPIFYGREETSLGVANVSQLITDSKNNVAPNLSDWLVRYGLDDRTQQAVKQFQYWLREHQILTRNLLPHNLAVAEYNGKLTLYIIDGLGAADVLSYLYPIKSWREGYIDRKIRNMNLRIKWEIDGRKGQWRTEQKRIISESIKLDKSSKNLPSKTK